MSMTQTIFGAGAIWGTLTLAWAAIAPLPPPIVVHELSYDAGYIVQDRTVQKPAWVAEWQAEIVSDKTGVTVPNCHGEGFWNYPGGRIAPRISLTEWVGNDLCSLPPGRFYPRATYWDGEFKAVVRGSVFEVQG